MTVYPLASRIVRFPSRTSSTAPGTPAPTTRSSDFFSDASLGGAAAAVCATTLSSRTEQIVAAAGTRISDPLEP